MTEKFVIGLVGFFLGGIIGAISMGCVLGNEYRNRLMSLQERNDILKAELKEVKTGKLEKKEKKLKAEEERYDKTLSTLGYSKEEKPDEENEGEGDFDSDESVEFNDPFEEAPIRVVGKAIFEEDLDYRDTEKLTFYRQDGILADETDDPVPNQAELIGMEAIELAENTDEDTLYVINDIEDKMYEIMVEKNESFYRDIL